MQRFSRRSVVGVPLAILAAVSMSSASAAPTVQPQLIDDSTIHAKSTTVGGATPVPTTRTIPHWYGQTKDATNGVTYGYNMVGADPFNCSGQACDVTVEVDITPLIVNVGGLTFSGSDVLAATLASPVFATNDYGMTPYATAAGAFPNTPAFIRGPGGTLSQGDVTNLLQLEDATMRAQFNQTGSSTYHLRLHPNVKPPVTINVPSNQGTLLQSGRGVIFADVDIGWWSAQINNLLTKADATHLPLFLTDNVLLFEGNNPGNCCVIGYHGTRAVGNGGGSANSNGNSVVQTFAWASWVQPGLYARPGMGRRSVREQHGRAVAHADRAAIRLQRIPGDR